MNRSYVLLTLTSPSGTAKLNFGDNDSSALGIQRFLFTGLVNPGAAFISFSKWATSPIIHGTNSPSTLPLSSAKFLLPCATNPICDREFQHPVYIMGGDNQTTGVQEIDYKLTDDQDAPLQFSKLYIWLERIPVSRYWPKDGDRRISNNERVELVERNENWTYDKVKNTLFSFYPH